MRHLFVYEMFCFQSIIWCLWVVGELTDEKIVLYFSFFLFSFHKVCHAKRRCSRMLETRFFLVEPVNTGLNTPFCFSYCTLITDRWKLLQLCDENKAINGEGDLFLASWHHSATRPVPESGLGPDHNSSCHTSDGLGLIALHHLVI